MPSQVALSRCQKEDAVSPAIAAVVENLGSGRIAGLLRGKRVLIKPNACIDHPPDRGATTHPAVLAAVLGLARDFGAEIVVGDGPAVGVPGRVFEATGISDVCRRFNLKPVDFNREEGIPVRLKDSYALGEALIAGTYFTVDTVVNLPVMKSNMLYWLSGALKNMKGLLVGLEKHRPHHLGVPECVADLNRMLRQDLVIMDGFIGMMGDGPAAGKPASAGLILAGFDPVAVDAAAATLMGFNPAQIPMLTKAAAAGVGSIEFAPDEDSFGRINLKWEKPMIARNTVKARLFNLAGRFFFQKMREHSAIEIDRDLCSRCGRCLEMCPFKAIEVRGDAVAIKRELCQFCLCCLEVCRRDAISLRGMMLRKAAMLR